jgi:hypothetical protein
MFNNKYAKALKLFRLYEPIFWGLLLVFCDMMITSLWIYSSEPEMHMEKLADFLMNSSQTILITFVIGGGLGGILNFLFDEMKREEEEVKNKWKERQENREKNKLFRWEMQRSLQELQDNVELARILIKSHRSGTTYGEQIRNRIMPSLISLQDFRRRVSHAEDRELIKNMEYLQVSLTYMISYLTVLVEEFGSHYLEISNLQNYQDALASRMRILFTEVTEGKKEDIVTLEKKKNFLRKAEEIFGQLDVPSKIEIVWQAMEELDYVWDFIGDLRDPQGKRSLYFRYFLQHYFNCIKILKDSNSNGNTRLIENSVFQNNLVKQQEIEAKKESDQPITQQDSLRRKIMSEELFFDFEACKRKVAAS